jgi:hypothetical protein
MKKRSGLALILVFSLGFFLKAERADAQGTVSFQVFYDQLSPYGSWVNYNPYGYVWIPVRVSRGFRPYGSAGHWIFTPDGWTWVSDYSWGWAPFHYGNWFYDEVYGWMWVPGYEWAPAWVTWGEYGNNYGWAPIGPSIQIGVVWNTYRPPVYCWTFVPRNYMGRSNMNSHYIHYNTTTTIVNRITVINNINPGNGRPQYMRGPQVQNVERYTRTTIRPVTIRESARPGREQVSNGQVTVYRPAVNRSESKPPAPSRVQSLEKVKPANLPGYNRNVRRSTQPAGGNRPAAPANHNQPAPSNQHPAPRPAPQTPRPAPQHQPARPAPQTPKPEPQHQPARPAPQTPRPEPQHQPARPAPQSPRPAQPENKPARPERR